MKMKALKALGNFHRIEQIVSQTSILNVSKNDFLWVQTLDLCKSSYRKYICDVCVIYKCNHSNKAKFNWLSTETKLIANTANLQAANYKAYVFWGLIISIIFY